MILLSASHQMLSLQNNNHKNTQSGVFLNADADTMFAQIMAQPDEMIRILLVNNTRIPLAKIDALDIENNPMQAELFAAQKITEIFHGADAAISAQENWRGTFSDRSFPDNAPEIKITQDELSVMEILKLGMPDTSNSELRRLVVQNAVTINDDKANNLNQTFVTDKPLCVRVGRKTFFKVLAK